MKWSDTNKLADDFGWCKCKMIPHDTYEEGHPKSFKKDIIEGCPFCERDGHEGHLHCPTCNKIIRLG